MSRDADNVRRAMLEDGRTDALTFTASIAPLQSAITIASDGGARVKIDIPESELPAIMRLALLRGQALKITIEADNGWQEDSTGYFSH
jgi:hypothetical protein